MLKQILLNISTGYAGKALGLALGFLLVPFLIRNLGAGLFGLIVLAESTAAFAETVYAAIRLSIARHAAFFLSKNNVALYFKYQHAGRLILAALIGFLLLALAAAAVFFLSGEARQQGPRPLVLLLIVMSAGFALNLPAGSWWADLYARQKMDWINLISSASLILRAALLFGLLSFFSGSEEFMLMLYGLAYAFMTGSKSIGFYLCSRRLRPEASRMRVKQRISLRRIKTVIAYGFFTCLGQGFEKLHAMVLFYLIHLIWGPVAGAVYALSWVIPSALERFYEEPAWTLNPSFTDLIAKNEAGKIRQLLFAYTKTAVLTAFPLFFLLFFHGREIITLWAGEDFGFSAELLNIHLLSLSASIPFCVCYCLLNATARIRVPNLVWGGALFTALGLGLVLSVIFPWGLAGFAVAEAAITAGFFFGFLLPYACRVSKVSLPLYLTQGYFRPLLAVLLFAAPFLFLAYETKTIWHGGISGVWLPLTGLILLTGFYLRVCYLFVLDGREKKRIEAFFRDTRKVFHKKMRPLAAYTSKMTCASQMPSSLKRR